METISRKELKVKMDRDDDFYLVDTMEEEYYRHARLPGAIHIPTNKVERVEQKIPDKEAEIIVYRLDPP